MIPLARAYLCLDCDGLYNPVETRGCPACGSAYVMPIATWLNREEAAPVPGTLTLSPFELLMIAETSNLDVTPEAWT